MLFRFRAATKEDNTEKNSSATVHTNTIAYYQQNRYGLLYFKWKSSDRFSNATKIQKEEYCHHHKMLEQNIDVNLSSVQIHLCYLNETLSQRTNNQYLQ